MSMFPRFPSFFGPEPKGSGNNQYNQENRQNRSDEGRYDNRMGFFDWPRFSGFGPSWGEMMRSFEDSFPRELFQRGSDNFIPRADLSESEKDYKIQVELPGLKKEDVNIEFTDSKTLSVEGHVESTVERGNAPKIESTEGAPAQNEKQSTEVTKKDTSGELVSTSDDRSRVWSIERQSGSFRRQFAFPGKVDHDNVKANLEHGILSIVVPKLQTSKETRKKIQVD